MAGTPLDSVGRDLTAAASSGDLWPPTYGEQTIARVLHHLDAGRSVMLIGPEGVGKTAVIRGIAVAMARRASGRLIEIPTLAWRDSNHHPWELHAVEIGHTAALSHTVITIPDLPRALQTEHPTGRGPSLIDILQPAIESDGLVILAEVNEAQLRRLRLAPRFTRLFERVPVEPLDREQAAAALYHEAERLELTLGHPTCEALLSFATRFYPDRPLPGPALDQLRTLAEAHQRDPLGAPIRPATVERLLCERTGLPPFIVRPSVTRRASELHAWFADRVVGQHDAIEATIETIALLKAGLQRRDRPLATLLFAGPPGSGRAALARALASYLFGSPDRMWRVDLTHARDGALFSTDLLDRVADQPYCVVLLDGIEHAPPSAWPELQMLLQSGQLYRPELRPVSFKSAVIIATTELGAASAGHGPPGDDWDARRRQVQTQVRAGLGPRHADLFQRIVPFHPLNREQSRATVRGVLSALLSDTSLSSRGLTVEADDTVIDLVIDQTPGQRAIDGQIARMVHQEIIVPVALTLLERPARRGQLIQVAASNGTVRVRIADPQTPTQAADEEMTFPFSGPIITRQGLAEDIAHARAEVESLSRSIREEALQATRKDLLQRRRSTDFWRDPDQAAQALRELDRLTSTLDRIKGLRARVAGLTEQLRGSDTLDRLERLATQVRQVELSLANAWRELVHIGDGGQWDAIVEVIPLDPDSAVARDLLTRAYQAWAAERRFEWRWLLEPEARAQGPHESALFAVRGRFAYGLLRMESGRHIVIGPDRVESVATVRVAPWTDRSTQLQVTAIEAVSGPGAFGGDLRTRLRCADGLILQNDLSPALIQDLATRVGGSWAAAPARATDLIRTYELPTLDREPAHVHDKLTGFEATPPDTLSPNHLHALLCLRIDHLATQWTAADMADDPTEA